MVDNVELDILEEIEEVLKACLSELDAMMQTYDDYVPSGSLIEQIEEAIESVEELKEMFS